jgi:hypothetical protein
MDYGERNQLRNQHKLACAEESSKEQALKLASVVRPFRDTYPIDDGSPRRSAR